MPRALVGASSFLLAVAACAQQVPPVKTAGDVDILGDVARSQVRWQKNLTVLRAIIAARPAGGITAPTFVLRTSGLKLIVLDTDLNAILRRGDSTTNVLLENSDILVVTAPIRDTDAAQESRARRIYPFLAAVDDSALKGERRVRFLAWRLEMDHDPKRCQRVIVELGLLGQKAVAAVPHLVKALGSKPIVAREAATTLGLIGASAKAALPALESLFEREDRALQARAKAAARQIRRALAGK